MRGFPLTWFDFYAWAKGPVDPEVYNNINGAFSEFVTSECYSDFKTIVNPVSDICEIDNGLSHEFSLSEISQIKRLIDIYSDLTHEELSELTHGKDSL